MLPRFPSSTFENSTPLSLKNANFNHNVVRDIKPHIVKFDLEKNIRKNLIEMLKIYDCF